MKNTNERNSPPTVENDKVNEKNLNANAPLGETACCASSYIVGGVV